MSKEMLISNSNRLCCKLNTTGLAMLCLLFTSAALADDPQRQPINIKKIKTETITDLRILVDISGSMKKTDPNNLRRSAIRLLAGLIPAGARAGIWNFGKQVNMTVKIGSVDDSWRKQARQQSSKINSVGLYTDIENALRRVSFDWQEADPRYKRNLILLTDGHVDVSRNNKLDKASRKRILKEILPMLEKAQVRIHTIALSDDVDERLLTTLSSYTDGLYKKVNNADELQKVFLQMLEQSVELDTVPVKDNRFNVDKNINDMTLLIFNNSSNPTTIVTPGKRTYYATTKIEQLKWYRDDGFDLITIKKPQFGQWKIIAPIDKNNRVVVVTNLKLKVNDLPSYIMLGDKLNVSAQLQEDGKPLEDQRLLQKFKFTVAKTLSGSVAQHYDMLFSEKNKSIFNYQIPPVFREGEYELVIKAKSPTVEREVRHQFKVYSTPAKINISDNHGKYKIKVTPYSNLLRLESVKINIKLKDGTQYELLQTGEDWIIEVDKKFYETMFSLTIDAVRADGKPMSVNFNKILSLSIENEGLSLPSKKKTVQIKKPDNKESAVKDKSKSKKKEKAKEDEVNWTLIIISIAAGNILIILVLGGGYIYIKRRKVKLAAAITEELDENESSLEEKSSKVEGRDQDEGPDEAQDKDKE